MHGVDGCRQLKKHPLNRRNDLLCTCVIGTGVKTRATGYTVVLVGLVIFMMPVSILAYVPKFFFGGILTFVSIDLMLEWLVYSRKLVVASEYLIILATFVAINVTTLEIGFAIGLGCCVLHFAFLYARATSADARQGAIMSSSRRATAPSTSIRGFKQRRLLAAHRPAIVVHCLEGYVFFGSAVRILREVKNSILVEDSGRVLAETPSAPNATVQNAGITAGSEHRGWLVLLCPWQTHTPLPTDVVALVLLLLATDSVTFAGH
eukprot:m.420639 g.420639  ORF g.420639 m.420639 type:complete len:263 (-) comp21318_c1_seq12:2688-3476(-)